MDASARPLRRGVGKGVASYALIAGAVLLGWQIAIQPIIQRAPVEAAVRLAPGSPLVLRRAAESELLAGRNDNARSLARDALLRSPFDVRALRVLGLSEAREGRDDLADEILTLAGNWSLRDDPAHAWLVDRRLKRGDYASAFAHADTLVRRREDIRPEVFRLFTLAGVEDRRSLPVLAALLAANPPWRVAYLGSLREEPKALQLAGNLAILLEQSRSPLSNTELQRLYRNLLDKGYIAALQEVRGQVNRPAAALHLANGDFSDPAAPQPFQWRLVRKAGVAAEIVGDDGDAENRALRVEYNGYATGLVAEQLALLPSGSYRFTVSARTEAGDPASRLGWTIACVPGGRILASAPGGAGSDREDDWSSVSTTFDMPASCPAAWVRLSARGNDHRSSTVAWYDQVQISRIR